MCAALFAVSGLICWCGISQVISNSVSSAFENAFHVPPLATTVVLTLLAALIVLRKNATVKSLDFIVPVMAVCYFVITVGIVVLNLRPLCWHASLPKPLACVRWPQAALAQC